MSTLIEYLPLILFFVAYKFADIYWASGILIVASLAQMAYSYFVHKSLSKRHWIFFAIALVLGTMTILFRDEHFIQWKATAIYALLAVSLLVSRVLFKKNLTKKSLQALLESAAQKSEGEQAQQFDVPESLWEKLNVFWIVLFAAIAALNIYVAYHFSLDTWVNFKVFGLMGITFAAIIITIVSIYRYFPEEQDS